MGRAWNDSGVVKCTFVTDNKIYSGPDVGGSIQLLVIDPGEKPRSFHYDWVNYKKAQSLTMEGKYEMVRCEYSASVYWPEYGLLGCVSTDKRIAYFVDNDSKIKSTKKIEDLLVLCKIAGSKESHVSEKEKEKSSIGNSIRLSNAVNDWEDYNWGSAWPTNRNVMSVPKNIPSVGFEQFVALWYRHGKPIMGRAWPKNGKIEASFVDVNREFTGGTVGSLQLLISLPQTTVGYEYIWMTYGQMNFAKVSSQQNQQLYSEASKIPTGSGLARDSPEDMSSSKDPDKDARKGKIPRRPEFNNGGSLEDCISNVYALLDLPGIKWKCFRPKPNAPRGLPLASDNVLKAYSKCINAGILSTWRRKPLPPSDNNEMLQAPHFSNDSAKELWVFWFDEEPESLLKYCEGLDSDEELSSANQMNIVSYEVRTILFKALHVVLERDLTKDGFVRFGRWFTVPFEARENYLHYMYPTHSPAIRFNFLFMDQTLFALQYKPRDSQHLFVWLNVISNIK
uniref:Med13_N domain-containing protein n=2 Tax=Caenorhabditis tropicalis TaxID=1561998 RepID=A0A1I7UBP7_9PELO